MMARLDRLPAPDAAAPCAPPHSQVSASPRPALVAAVVAAVALGLAGCERGAAHGDGRTEGAAGRGKVDAFTLVPAGLPVPDAARQEIADLVALLQPLDPTLTSNHHDEQYWREKARIEALERREKEVGWAALHAFCNYPERDFKVKRTLLRVGARAAPEEAKALLEALTFTYGFPIEDRTEACLLFAEVAPERYKELARPFLVRRGVLRETLPDDEFLVKGWVKACEASGTSASEVMADVATNLMIDGYARVVALRALGSGEQTPEARGALQTCLIESMGDGFIRRVAAQQILNAFAREDACALLREVFSREADPAMATFLDELLQERCR